MAIRVGINGFGRIGRNIFRAQMQDPAFKDIEIVAVNDLTDNKTLAHLLKYDSVAGRLGLDVTPTESGMTVDGRELKIFCERDPANIPWSSVDVDYVIESTGFFTKMEAASKHLQGSVKRVIISAPAGPGIKTMVMGVNEGDFDPATDKVVSNASCTTNCLAPFAKVIHEAFGIERGLMTTVHAYTNDQVMLDQPHKDLRRARAAAVSMIPTKTGAAAAIGLVLPELQGKFDGLSVRVPTPDVSIVDAVMVVNKPASVESVNAALKAAQSRFLGYTEEPLVSIDLLGDARSSIVDAGCTKVIDNQVKVMSWYDNEWGYSNRVLDLLNHMVANGG
ncbi:type I glyceraldehyde-3-phosphate dehydrogenase [Magnetofaba australis]|uniref:Glyceraldehyde-3-phosphate dehydrogenase n=1 Tax=Magnetofaba australis IT-1 TaxID=1434232 RepID=A0A1Y2K8A1_9PROT|nr:type I glyceraldehyde-3-phosphate dehydrogenase [Magnetofaba australis]OSM06953.1 putative glyceraldehyde-3-phosphate dehydrogenase [Magnetofaba australis IT-1]